MIRQYRTAAISGDAPYNSPYSTDAEFKRALAAAVGAQQAGLGDEPVYSTMHGLAKVGTSLAGAFMEKSASDMQRQQNAVLLADALGAIGETPTIGGTISTPSGSPKSASSPDNVADYTARVTNTAASGPSKGAFSGGITDLTGHFEGTDKGRGYNETLAYGKFTGGPVDLENMPIRDVVALQRRMLAHPENTFNSSALGRHQIVGKTLRGLIAKGVVKEDELFSPEVQDRAALHLAEARGRNPAALRQEWAGLKNADDETILAAYDRTFGTGRATDTGTQPGRTPTERVQLASNDPTFVPIPPTRPVDLGNAIAGAPVAPTTSAGRLNALTGGRAGEPDLGQDVATGAATVLGGRGLGLGEAATATESMRGAGMGAATAMANPSVRPAIDPRLMNLYLYGDDRGRAIAAQLIQQQQKPAYEYREIGGNLVAINPRNPNDRHVVFQAPETTTTAAPGSAIVRGGKIVGYVPDKAREPEKEEYIEVETGPEGQRVKELRSKRTGRPPPADPNASPPPPPPTPANPYAMPGKNTEEQQKNKGFADRMAQAHGQMVENEAAGVDTTETLKNMVPFVSNRLISESKQKLNQAEENFLTAILRRESGASISPTEFATGEKMYFPRPGDTPAVLEQKRRARETAMQGVMAGAGPNYKPPEIKAPPSDDGWTEIDGVRVRRKN